MKHLFWLCAIAFLNSCSTNYYTVILEKDTNVYQQKDTISDAVVLTKGTTVYLEDGESEYRRFKFNNTRGWVYNYEYPSYKTIRKYNKVSRSSQTKKASINSSYAPGKTVNVRGYYRKSGTYVSPHTRSAPRRK